jgi:hypothetical protein
MKPAKLVWLFLSFLPGYILFGMILRHGVNVPHWDQWDTPAIQIIDFAKGTLSFGDLLSQHNEARPLFPRLLFIALAQLGGWHVKREMFVTLALAGLVSIGLFRLSRQTVAASTVSTLGLWAVTNWLLFSPSQWDNWFWGFQVATLVPIACILASLLILNQSWSLWGKLLSCGTLATIGSFSFANGLLAWIVLFPAIIAAAWGKPRQWWLPMGWILWAIAVGLLYFYNYESPKGLPSMVETLQHPVNVTAFFFVYLGSPFGFGDRYAAALFGGLLLCGFGIFLGYSLRQWRVHKNRGFLRQSLPWLVISSYTILSGLLTTAGRASFGLQVALAPKYITFSTFLPIALIYGLALIAPRHLPRWKNSKSLKRFGIGLAGLFLAGYLLTYAYGMRGLMANYQTRLFAKSCLMLINVTQETDCVEAHNALYPVRMYVLDRANQLNDQGILRPRLASEAIYKQFQVSEPAYARGMFDNFAPDDDGNFTAFGWAILPEQEKPADAVLMTYTLPTGERQILQIIRVGQLREDVADAVGQPYLHSGWQATVLVDTIPADAVWLDAWAFDVAEQKAYSLGQNFAQNLSSP